MPVHAAAGLPKLCSRMPSVAAGARVHAKPAEDGTSQQQQPARQGWHGAGHSHAKEGWRPRIRPRADHKAVRFWPTAKPLDPALITHVIRKADSVGTLSHLLHKHRVHLLTHCPPSTEQDIALACCLLLAGHLQPHPYLSPAYTSGPPGPCSWEDPPDGAAGRGRGVWTQPQRSLCSEHSRSGSRRGPAQHCA
jgi:hypothetical protein